MQAEFFNGMGFWITDNSTALFVDDKLTGSEPLEVMVNNNGLFVVGSGWATAGICGTRKEQVEEAAESENSMEEVAIEELSVMEKGDVEEQVGLELELFFRGICADRGCIEPVLPQNTDENS